MNKINYKNNKGGVIKLNKKIISNKNINSLNKIILIKFNNSKF